MSRKPSNDAGEFRSGFACLVGRPNAGKSTLTNALVGEKVAITSGRPQTTRHTIRGIVHRDDAQLVLVDTPGLHRPRTLLGERLNTLVRDTLTEVDVIVFCLPADQKVGPGDRFIASELAALMRGRRPTPVVAAVTKADKVSRQELADQLLSVAALGDWADIVPVSAVGGYQVDELADVLVSRLPVGPMLYPDGELTDEPEAVMVAELVREAALEGVRDELPHSLAVVVDEIVPVDDVLARDTARRLAAEEGIFAGLSSGATIAAALKVAGTAPEGSVLLAMLPDTGERYLSTFLFEGVNEGSDDAWLESLG